MHLHGDEMDQYMETTLFLQISNSSAILILSSRTLGFFFTTFPAWQLMFTTMFGQVIINACVFFGVGDGKKQQLSQMDPMDILYAWIYDFAWLLLLDVVQMIAGAI